MERYPFDALPSGNRISELVDFTDYYNDPFLNEAWRLTRQEMMRFTGGPPIPLHFVGEGFGNLPQEVPLSSNDNIDDQRPEWDISPQVEPIQYDVVAQEEQPQGAAISQERIYPVFTYTPQQTVWVQPLSAMLLPIYLPTTNTQAISNSNEVPVVITHTTQRISGLFAQTINVIDISPNNQQQQSQLQIPPPLPPTPPSPPPPPPISPQTPTPQQEETSERAPKKIPVPVLQIKPLAKTRKSRARRIRIEFHCDVPGCNKTLTSSSNLNEHKKTHSGLKPYKCDESLCRWKFARLSELKRHKSCKHSSVKLYGCGYCTKRIARQDQFVKHEKACSVRKLESMNK